MRKIFLILLIIGGIFWQIKGELIFQKEKIAEKKEKPKLIILPATPTNEEIEKILKKVKRKYGGRIKLAAKRHNFDPNVILAVIVIESSGNFRAFSKAKALGLMQLKKNTASAMGIKNPFHPYENIWAGTKYLKLLTQKYGDLYLALAAYNLGPKRLERLLKKNNFDVFQIKYIKKFISVKNVIEEGAYF